MAEENQAYIEIGSSFNPEGMNKGLEKGVKEAQSQVDKNPINVRVEVKDLEKAKDVITKQLSGDLRGIGDNFHLIKTELKEIKSGEFKGLIQSVETFSNGLGETKQRLVVFKENASGAYDEVDAKIQKVIAHNLNYQQAMELTAKKLSTLNQEVSKSPIYDEQGILKGWKTTTTALMSSGQELKTIVTETENAGIYTKETRQEIRKWDKDFKELESDYEKFGETSVETINLREQAEQKYLSTLKKESQEIHRISTIDKTGNLTGTKGTKVESVWKTITDQYGTQYQTIIQKWQDDLGNTIERTSARIKEQGKAWTKLEEISRKVTSDEVAQANEVEKEQEKLNKTIKNKITTNNSYNKIIKGTTHQIEQESVVTKNYAGELEKTSKITDTFTDSQGRLVTTITSVNAQGQETTQTLIKMGNSAKHLGQSFTDVLGKVAKFYLASLPIRAVQNSITEAVESVKDFDSALTEFKKVSDLSGKSLDEYTLKLEKLGELTARTRTEMVQMATEFKRSGFDDEDAAQLAQTASLYQNIADEELSASDAASVLISQMKAFKLQAKDAEHVIDAINEVANRNAVSSGDIGRGLTQAGAALSTYGNTFEQTIGLVTAGTEIFQGKSQQVARGLNTVASRITKNAKALKEYDIDIYDVNGDLKSTYDVLSELAPKWNDMTKAEQVALGTTLAGVNQYKVFSAVMTNFNTAVKASKEALNSQGSAMQENEKYMDSIQARLQQLKAELQKFVLEGNTLQKVFKLIISAGTNIIKFFNTFQGKVTLISISIIALIANFDKLKIAFAGSYIMKFIKLIDIAIISINGFRTGVLTASGAVEWFDAQLKALNINPVMLAISAIVAVLAATAIGIYKVATLTESYSKKLEEINSKIEEAKQKQEEYKNRLKEIASEMEEINSKGLDLDKNSENNLRKLKMEQVELERLLKLQQQAEKKEQKKASKKAEDLLMSPSSTFFSPYWTKEGQKNQFTFLSEESKDFLVGGGYTTESYFDIYRGIETNQMGGLRNSLIYVKAYSAEFEKLYKKKQEYGYLSKEEQKQLEYYKEKLELASEKAGELAANVQKAVDSSDGSNKSYKLGVEVLSEYDEVIGNVGEASKEIIGISDDLEDSTEDVDEAFETVCEDMNATAMEAVKAKDLLDELGLKENELQKQIGMSSIELVRQAESWRTNARTLYDYLTALGQLNESIDNVQSSYQTLKSAVDEYNETGAFSIDTLQTLLSMSPEYLQALFDENGELRIQNGILQLNEEAIKDEIHALANKAKQEVYNNAVNRILNLTTDENTEKNIINKKAYEDSTKAIQENSDALVENARATLANTVADARKGGVRDTYINQILKETEEQLKLIDKMVEGVGKDFSTAMGNSKNSTKDTNNALKEQNNLLKQQKQLLEEKKKQYDSVVAYIKKKIQDEIKAIEAEKKAQVDAIKDQIDALKDLKEEELDRIQEQIDALKDQKSVEQEYWQEKIDALKEQNEELNTQLEREELLENLAKAKAKRVRVYKDGRFVYDEDTNEVDKARAKLEEFDRKQTYEEQLKTLENYKKKSEENYEAQIKALEKLKEEKEKNYEQQIKDLEKYQEQVEADYDARIKYFQDYLDKFTKQTDAYENETNRQLAIQLTGIDFEQQGWQTRLDNLADFVERYNALLGDINTLDENDLENTDITKKTITDDDGDDTDEDKGDNTTTTEVSRMSKEIAKKVGNYYSGNTATTNTNALNKLTNPTTVGHNNTVVGGHKADTTPQKTSGTPLNTIVVSVGKKASGDSYIKNDGAYLVGDSPNQELVVGSKLNGNLMNLTKGSGVVNSNSTRTLAGVLNQLGSIGNQGINMSNSQNKSTNINIGNISLPSVQNGKDFVDYLQNFSLQMTQEAFA